MSAVTPQVTLVDHTTDPWKSMYLAFRTCYSKDTPQRTLERIESGSIKPATMKRFCMDRLATGHVSPLEQVVFQFAISGVSRAFSHQFVRTRVGFSPEQASQRYIVQDGGDFDYVMPKTVATSDETHFHSGVYWDAVREFENATDEALRVYRNLLELGIPAEDARFVLPNAAATNLVVTINFAALLHMGDLRLCHRAQWEYRKVVALMRAEVKRKFPELASFIQPKCGENRLGYCDESVKDYEACPLSKVRPHKDTLLKLYSGSKALAETDIEVN